MKHEKLIVAVLFVFLLGLSVGAVLASRVPPKANMRYGSFPGKPGRVETVPIQAVPITEPSAPVVTP